MNLFEIIKQNALKYPKKIALVIENKEYSYEIFYKLILQTINNLKNNNFNKNSKVLIVEDNTLEHILALFSLSYINAVAIPTGTYYSYNHLSDIIKITNADSIIGNKNHCNFFKKNSKIKNFLCTEKSNKFSFFFKINNGNISPKKKINKDKEYIITMSSGSTSKPKPIIFSQSTKIIRYKLFRDLYKIKNKDNFIVTSPIDHSLGMRTLFVPLLEGCTCVVMRKFLVPQYCELIKKYKITFSVLVANQIYEILENQNYFKNFYLKKGLVSASAKLFPKAKSKLIKKKINLYEMYGAAEIGTVTSINLLKDKKNLKSVGKSYNRNIKIKILSENNVPQPYGKIGEIACKTPGEFKEYHNSKILNKNAYYKKFFKTGDIGYLNNKGYLFFLSRKKNIIRRSGITIYPEDIENIFLKDVKIKEVAVIGKETKIFTKIYLFILKSKNLNESYIRNICLKKLSKFQIPNQIIFLKKFPKTNLGKINKIKLLRLVR
jgi:long-chain acyl-CoA synthetase